MKSRPFTLILLALITVALVLPAPALGQTEAPSIHGLDARPPYGPAPLHHPDAARGTNTEALDEVGLPREPRASLPHSEAVVPGRPGLSFRHLEEYGETDIAYVSDASHFNYPYGLGADGNNVWIAELWGERVLEVDANGRFVSSLGKGGTRGPFWEPNDVAIDAGGRTWVASGAGVAAFDAEGNEVQNLWRDADANTHFGVAASIAFDAVGNIYVSDGAPWWGLDEGNHRIQVFTPAGDYLATIGSSGTAGAGNLQFHGPRHITIYQNTLYVADSGNHRVQIIDVSNPRAPVYVGTIGATGEAGSDNTRLSNPSGVAVDANYIFVADRWNNRIQVYARQSRAYLHTITGEACGGRELKEPADVAVTAGGTVYVADFVNTLVVSFSPQGDCSGTFGQMETPYVTDTRHYFSPTGVAVAKDGSLYLTEEMGHRLVKLSPGGVPLWTVGKAGVKGDWNDAPDRLDNPSDVALDASERVYVADRWHGRVQIYNQDGSYFASLYGNTWMCPSGVAFDRLGRLYVSDACNQRVQIFGANLQFETTLGVSGEPGSDNAHLNNPEDVVVDSRGVIYVSDRGNHRVQVFNPNRSYQRTIGVTGECGDDFGHFCNPNNLAADGADRLYVADADNNRVQVFDKDGAYLTSVGGWGKGHGQMQSADGVAVGPNGDLYVAEWGGMRVQRFALGVPGWKQVNVNGFGNRYNGFSGGLASFGGQLYAGNYGNLAELWGMAADGSWATVMTGGFGDPSNVGIDDLLEYNDKLYAGTYNVVCDDPSCQTAHSTGGQIWRSGDGQNWEKVVADGFGDTRNWEVQRLAVFKGQLYAGTWSGAADHGLELWRSATGDRESWTRVVTDGFGDPNNAVAPALAEYDNQFYAGTRNGTGGEVWRSPDGSAWTQVNLDGFGSDENRIVESLVPYGGYLYAGTYNASTGGQIWRCVKCDGSDWSRVVADGFGKADNLAVAAFQIAGTRLYAITNNYTGAGTEVWRSSNGVEWEQVSPSGFGDSNNRGPYFGNSVAIHAGRLFIGTTNYANGFEIWAQSLTADFTATPLRGRPPLTVQFTNTSAGDYTSSVWDFGDGQTSAGTNPTHTYAKAGAYAVMLTVGDGTNSDTLTREAAVRVGYPLYLPAVTRNADPLMYDDFDDLQWNGAWNPAKWTPDLTAAVYRQQSGALIVTEPPSSNQTGGTFRSSSPHYRLWRQAQRLEARLKTSSDRTGGYSPIGIAVDVEEVNGHTWTANCQLGAASNEPSAFFGCSIFTHELSTDTYVSEYGTQGVSVDYDTYCTARIELEPASGAVRFYLNDTLIGSHLPADAATLITSDRVQMVISDWGQEPNSTATRYVDWVRLTPAK